MSQTAIRIDYSLAMAEGVGDRGGLRPADLTAESATFAEGVRRVLTQVNEGRLGFWSLPQAGHLVDAVDRLHADLPRARDVIVLGIGGSSLGTRALAQALCAPPEVPAPHDHARLHLPDNSDPWLLSHLLEQLDPAQTLVIAVSKSGGTVETAAQLLVLRQWLGRLGGDEARARLVVVTDPQQGPLRSLATQERLRSLEVPTNVGGRFSVLSPVGLLPARLQGIDVRALLAGADAMAERCANEELVRNPAGILAAVHVLQHRLFGRHLHVMMPYADRLRAFSDWYVQLWAESLGKRTRRGGQVVESGPTPLAAIGATDQHAQVQLFMEGPRDKLVTFVQVEEHPRDLSIPATEGDFSYLGGGSLGALLDAERRGTTQALAQDGRPSVTVQLPRLDAASMGELFFLYEAATAFAGELYDIDAFDQPGVEKGKRLAFGLLGRTGYEAAADEIRQAETQNTGRHVV